MFSPASLSAPFLTDCLTRFEPIIGRVRARTATNGRAGLASPPHTTGHTSVVSSKIWPVDIDQPGPPVQLLQPAGSQGNITEMSVKQFTFATAERAIWFDEAIGA